MKKIKIIFFDIDGTLIDFTKKRISEKTLETLVRLKEKGIILCLATGRSPMTLPDFKGIAFDVFLTFNGSYCYNSEKVIFSNPIPSGEVKKLIDNAAKIGRPVSIATKDSLAANGADQDLIDYFGIAGLKVNVTKDFDKLLREEIYQVMMGCYQALIGTDGLIQYMFFTMMLAAISSIIKMIVYTQSRERLLYLVRYLRKAILTGAVDAYEIDKTQRRCVVRLSIPAFISFILMCIGVY